MRRGTSGKPMPKVQDHEDRTRQLLEARAPGTDHQDQHVHGDSCETNHGQAPFKFNYIAPFKFNYTAPFKFNYVAKFNDIVAEFNYVIIKFNYDRAPKQATQGEKAQCSSQAQRKKGEGGGHRKETRGGAKGQAQHSHTARLRRRD
jgi:hypothetical protein